MIESAWLCRRRGERLRDAEGGGLAAPPDCWGKDSTGSVHSACRPSSRSRCPWSRTSPPLRYCGPALATIVLSCWSACPEAPAPDRRVVIAHDEVYPADHLVLVTASHQARPRATRRRSPARAPSGCGDRLVDVPVDDAIRGRWASVPVLTRVVAKVESTPTAYASSSLTPRPPRAGRRILEISKGVNHPPVKTAGLPGVHGSEVDDRVGPSPGGGVADVVELTLNLPRRAGVAVRRRQRRHYPGRSRGGRGPRRCTCRCRCSRTGRPWCFVTGRVRRSCQAAVRAQNCPVSLLGVLRCSSQPTGAEDVVDRCEGAGGPYWVREEE